MLQVLCCPASPRALAGPCPVAQRMMVMPSMYASDQLIRLSSMIWKHELMR